MKPISRGTNIRAYINTKSTKKAKIENKSMKT